MLTRADLLKQMGLAAAALLGAAGLPAQPTRSNSPSASARPRADRHLERPVPRLGISIPALGMGTWQTFDTANPEKLRRLAEVLAIFYAAGGRVLDSSPMYGRAEDVVGRLTAKTKQRDFFLATKVWTRGRAAGRQQIERSMQLMQARSLGLLQVHNLIDWRTHLKTLRALKEQGRVRSIGITHYVPAAFGELEKIIRTEEIDFVQLPYSIVLRDAEQRLLPLCRDRRVATIINRPFEGGGLFRRTRGRKLPAKARAMGCVSWSNVFLKFILSHPDVTCVIPATGKPVHARDNMRAAFGRLPTASQRDELARLVGEL